MSVSRRRGARGAVAIAVVAATGWLLGAAYAVDVLGNVLATQHRAQSAADAAAHAAAGELVDDPHHEDIALLVGRRPLACWYAAIPAYAAPGAALDDRCAAAVSAASDVVAASAHAQLLRVTVVDDPRDDQALSDAPTRLQALATVAVERRLPVPGRSCDVVPGEGSSLCFAVATAAAQEA